MREGHRGGFEGPIVDGFKGEGKSGSNVGIKTVLGDHQGEKKVGRRGIIKRRDLISIRDDKMIHLFEGSDDKRDARMHKGRPLESFIRVISRGRDQEEGKVFSTPSITKKEDATIVVKQKLEGERKVVEIVKKTRSSVDLIHHLVLCAVRRRTDAKLFRTRRSENGEDCRCVFVLHQMIRHSCSVGGTRDRHPCP